METSLSLLCFGKKNNWLQSTWVGVNAMTARFHAGELPAARELPRITKLSGFGGPKTNRKQTENDPKRS